MGSHPRDRLYRLSTYRLALRSNDFTSPASVLNATGKQLAGLPPQHRADIVRIVRAGDPDVMRALFLPRVPIDWQVAGMDSDPFARLISVSRSAGARVHDQIVDLTYRIDDDGRDERHAWVVLRDAVRSVALPCPSSSQT
jgi:hypothetical protein